MMCKTLRVGTVAAIVVWLLGTEHAVAVPVDIAEDELPSVAVSKAVDQLLFGNWGPNNITPSRLVDDATFLRRATLDIVGRIPTPTERRAFLMNPSADKRRRLVHRLLYSEEYSHYWAQVWTAWLLARGSHPDTQDHLRGWLEKEFARGTSHRDLAIKLLAAQGKIRDNGAVAFLAEARGTDVPGPKQLAEGRYDMVPATARAARLFLGTDVSCVQCHDHPFDPNGKQKHFWGLNAFFRQMDLGDARGPAARRAGAAPEWVLAENRNLNPNGIVFWENRRGVVLANRPTYFDTKKFDPKIARTRREQVADFIVDDPRFAQAFVNRMWAQFLGRSLTEQAVVDDFGGHNLPLDPPLLDLLAAEFVTAKHDPRVLIGWLCNTEAYQRDCAANATNAGPDRDIYFSRMLPKPLSPEQLLGASLVAARGNTTPPGVRQQLWKRWIGTFAREASEVGALAGCLDRHAGQVPPQITLMQLLDAREFDSEAKGSDAETLGRVGRMKDVDQIIGVIYLAVLGRQPTLDERGKLRREVATLHEDSAKDLTPLWMDLYWALRNSSEFFLNH